MKFTYIKDTNRSEVVVYSKDKNNLINQIENLCIQDTYNLVGYNNSKIRELNPTNIEYFLSFKEKVYACTDNENYLIKKRLYELKDLLKDNFIYINQSCLANLNKIDHFEVPITGSLVVVFKSGYKDYVSRRQIKNVKERIIKK